MPKYVLMLLEDDDWVNKQPREEKERGYAQINKWWEDLSKTGVVRGGEELQPKRTATTVRRVNGSMKVTEGPFIESKEHVGGFLMVEVPDLDAAIAIAKSWPGGDVEVRPIVVH
jgi:hypothetical protein